MQHYFLLILGWCVAWICFIPDSPCWYYA